MFSAQRPVINVYFYYASAIYSQDRVKSFLAPITLRLFHFNSLARWFHFDAVEVQMKATNFVNAFRGSHELRVALELCMTRDLDGKNHYWKFRINNDDRRAHTGSSAAHLPENDFSFDIRMRRRRWKNWNLYRRPLDNAAQAWKFKRFVIATGFSGFTRISILRSSTYMINNYWYSSIRSTHFFNFILNKICFITIWVLRYFARSVKVYPSLRISIK